VGLEYDIFMKVSCQITRDTKPIQKTSRLIAYVDGLSCLASVAVRNGYVRPEITEDDVVQIEEGRHPVVEQLLEQGHFVANDTCFDHDQNRLLVITGPNMAGKSTYIRQVALITIMAQMGSFVPAKKANIGLVDRIFTRVGASDELSRGASTFMVEMIEVANILNNATHKSLIILDEVGRGTSTFDGVSIAWAVAEYIHDERHVGARTLFATHYHELTELELLLPKVKNYNISVKEWDDEIIFLRKIVPGGTDKSYGIHVARLAGLPKVVIERAKEILANLEMASLDEKGLPSFAKAPSGAPSVSKADSGQLTFYQDLKHPIVEKIEKLDVDRMTPMEALQFISEIKKETKNFLQAQGKS
ncbi:DNA mismatch repair protein MutS, partial [PVC group bacterium]|nr:DNA mismatch repair protein MutS [PVC group bacterium]